MSGAAQHSSEDSRQRLPLNDRRQRVARVVAATAAVLAAVAAVVVDGIDDRVAIAALVVAVLVVVAALVGGNRSAAALSGIGPLLIVLGLLSLGLHATAFNVFDATIANVIWTLLLGVVVGTCGMYCWQVDDEGRVQRRPRATVSRHVEDADQARDRSLEDEPAGRPSAPEASS